MVRKKYCLLVLSLRAKRRFWAHATTTPSDDARRGDVQSRCTFPLCCTHTLRLKNTFYKMFASPLESKLFVLTANATTTPSSIMLPWCTTQNTFWPQLQCCSHTHIPMPQVDCCQHDNDDAPHTFWMRAMTCNFNVAYTHPFCIQRQKILFINFPPEEIFYCCIYFWATGRRGEKLPNVRGQQVDCCWGSCRFQHCIFHIQRQKYFL